MLDATEAGLPGSHTRPIHARSALIAAMLGIVAFALLSTCSGHAPPSATG